MGENENKSCTQHLYLKECQHFRKSFIKDRCNTTTKKKYNALRKIFISIQSLLENLLIKINWISSVFQFLFSKWVIFHGQLKLFLNDIIPEEVKIQNATYRKVKFLSDTLAKNKGES